ncbi:glycosyltransferase [Synechococcus sp. MU1655]|uniref:glycosyltransferase n=1 Tax=Synechococcus sp. MU1655 TaxID=2508355 RepID=UPI0020266EE2|nr:glycosyltransferase [Synechococcus sp. MU1655]
MKKILFFCDQDYSIHFPSHFREVYSILLSSENLKTVVYTPSTKISSLSWLSDNFCIFPKSTSKIISPLWPLISSLYLFRILFVQGSSFDLVIVHDNPLSIIVSYFFSLFNGFKLVFRISNLKGLMSKSTSFVSLINKNVYVLLTCLACKLSSAVVSMSVAMESYLRTELNITNSLIYTIPSCTKIWQVGDADSSDLFTIDSIYNITNHSPRDVKLVYLGTLNPNRELTFLLDLVEELLSLDLIPFLGVFGVSRLPSHKDQFLNAVKSRQLDSYIYLFPPVLEQSLPNALQYFDIGISPYDPNTLLSTNSPLKTLDYIVAGIPVLSTKILDHRETLLESRGGICEEYDSSSFAISIHSFVRNPHIYDIDILYAQSWLRKNRSLDSCTLMWKNLVRDMLYV